MKLKYILENNNFNKIKDICDGYLTDGYISNYTINADGSVDVDGDVYITHLDLNQIPIIFGNVNGNFSCESNNLKNLKNCPKNVGGSYNCGRNLLVTLKGCPSIIYGGFDCGYNRLASLKYGPIEVNGDYHCDDNKLTSLEGCPKIINGSFNFSNNLITNFKYMPKIDDGWISYKDNPIPKEIVDNDYYLEDIILMQDDYGIWNKDGSLNKYRFDDMMEEIKTKYPSHDIS